MPLEGKGAWLHVVKQNENILVGWIEERSIKERDLGSVVSLCSFIYVK